MQSLPEQYLSAADWARLQAVNRNWNDDIVTHRATVVDVYTPLARRADKRGVRVLRDISYGADARHKLDLFLPEVAGLVPPVILFVHGGAFTRGAKSANGEIFDNVLYWFARRGFVGVNVEYRLAPAAPYPAGAQDVAKAVGWVSANIASHGGAPKALILMGHSAGGCHVASYLLDPAVGTSPAAGIKAAILVSARLRLDCRPDNPNAKNVELYCGSADAERLKQCSPISYVERCRWPLLLATAEFENRHLDTYAAEFGAALAMTQGRGPPLVEMKGHNHTSIVAHFNTGEDTLGHKILDFVGPLLTEPTASWSAAGDTPHRLRGFE